MKSQPFVLLKRIFDILVSFTLLLILSPVFLILAIIIKITSYESAGSTSGALLPASPTEESEVGRQPVTPAPGPQPPGDTTAGRLVGTRAALLSADSLKLRGCPPPPACCRSTYSPGPRLRAEDQGPPPTLQQTGPEPYPGCLSAGANFSEHQARLQSLSEVELYSCS